MIVKKALAELDLERNLSSDSSMGTSFDANSTSQNDIITNSKLCTDGLKINNYKLYLASASPRRQQLLEQIGILPDEIVPADIDEKPILGESVNKMTARLALNKAQKVASGITEGFVLAADTAIEIGGKSLGKAHNLEEVLKMISRLSGKKHRVYTTVALIKVSNGVIEKHAHKTSKTIIALKKLTPQELKEYVVCGLGIGREGGFNIQTQLEAFVKSVNGSYSGIIGLPLYETNNLLTGLGFW